MLVERRRKRRQLIVIGLDIASPLAVTIAIAAACPYSSSSPSSSPCAARLPHQTASWSADPLPYSLVLRRQLIRYARLEEDDDVMRDSGGDVLLLSQDGAHHSAKLDRCADFH